MPPTATLITHAPTVQLDLRLDQAQALAGVLRYANDNPFTDPILEALQTIPAVFDCEEYSANKTFDVLKGRR